MGAALDCRELIDFTLSKTLIATPVKYFHSFYSHIPTIFFGQAAQEVPALEGGTAEGFGPADPRDQKCPGEPTDRR